MEQSLNMRAACAFDPDFIIAAKKATRSACQVLNGASTDDVLIGTLWQDDIGSASTEIPTLAQLHCDMLRQRW